MHIKSIKFGKDYCNQSTTPHFYENPTVNPIPTVAENEPA